MTEEVMMVPTREFERLTDYYKGQISESALLNKAGRLAAEQHLILKNPKIPDATAVKMLKPLAREQTRLTKRVRLGPTPAVTVRAPNEGDEGMVESPLENMLRSIIKGTTPKRKAILVTPAPSGTVSAKKKHVLPLTQTIQKKPPTSRIPILKKETSVDKGKGKSGLGQAVRKGAAKSFLKAVGLDPNTFEEQPNPNKKKKKKTEVERLKPSSGWEDWAVGKKLKRNLQRDYDSD